jgi:hypothetical protein
VDTSRENEIRFDRDFKGKTFADRMIFGSLTEEIFGGTYAAHFDGENHSGFGDDVICGDIAKGAANQLIDWKSGQTAYVSGQIDTTMFGTVFLKNCQFSIRS